MSHDSVKDDLRRLMLAATGAAGMAADEAKKLVAKLVSRGELAQREAKAVYDRIVSSQTVKKAAASAADAARKVADATSRGWDAVLTGLNIPSRADLDALQKKVAELERRLRARKPRAKK
jgi:poly(hydroxyalkanoate) granule-associated protein